MKTLIFKNGVSVDFVECYSEHQYIQGAQRDVLDFRFDAKIMSMNEIDNMFTADECSKLIIRETTIIPMQVIDEEGNLVLEEVSAIDDAGNTVIEQIPVMQDVERTEDFVHKNYGVRVALSKQFFTLYTVNGEEEVEQISVKIAQYTPVELQIAALTETVDILVMDSLMA